MAVHRKYIPHLNLECTHVWAQILVHTPLRQKFPEILPLFYALHADIFFSFFFFYFKCIFILRRILFLVFLTALLRYSWHTINHIYLKCTFLFWHVYTHCMQIFSTLLLSFKYWSGPTTLFLWPTIGVQNALKHTEKRLGYVCSPHLNSHTVCDRKRAMFTCPRNQQDSQWGRG